MITAVVIFAVLTVLLFASALLCLRTAIKANRRNGVFGAHDKLLIHWAVIYFMSSGYCSFLAVMAFLQRGHP